LRRSLSTDEVAPTHVQRTQVEEATQFSVDNVAYTIYPEDPNAENQLARKERAMAKLAAASR